MKFIATISVVCALVATSGCMGYRVDPNKVKENDPQFYEEWKVSLKERGMTDEDLKACGFEN